MSGAEVVTFGCRLNLAEGEAVRAVAPAGVAVVNSCAVTGEAVRQAIKAVRRLHRAAPGRPILVTGCAAELDPERFAALPGVVAVLGNAEKTKASSYSPFGRVKVGGIWNDRMPLPLASADRTRAFVQVQTGCDHRCTFCIIPFARGNGRSVPPAAVVEKVAALVGAGAREVVLTGVDLTGYGADLPGGPTLGDLAASILAEVPGLPRLRLSSLDAVEIDPLLAELVAGEPRLMPHLHLSLQSGDDLILKRMRRRHSRAQAVALVAGLKARRPELAVGADLIAGFPTETAAQAANSLALLEDCDIVLAHIFPYSPRPGTPAARMPQVEPEVARERARRLREAAAARQAKWLAGIVGSVQRVLIERDGTGRTENFARVRLTPLRHPREGGDPSPDGTSDCDGPEMDSRLRGNDDAGNIVKVRILSAEADHLIGIPA